MAILNNISSFKGDLLPFTRYTKQTQLTKQALPLHFLLKYGSF